jgi:MFS transporter, DHA3 family, macrolide efflux protein
MPLRNSGTRSRLPSRFWAIWVGQVVTLAGNSVLRFAFVVHAWAAGEQATRVVALSLSAMLPQLLLSPIAGALVDRCRKRTALRLTDLGGLVVVVGLCAVDFSGQLDLWQIYAAVALLGASAAFQYPAVSSAVPLLVEKDQYQRANGLIGSASSIATVSGPILAGILIGVAGLGLILCVDLASFIVMLACVQLISLPEPPRRDVGKGRVRPWRRLAAESAEGLRYLLGQPSLRGLTLVFFAVNLVMMFGFAVLQPMILARSGNSSADLASVMACIGVGGVAGGLLLNAWGGPENRIRGMMLGTIGMCLSAQVGAAIARSVTWWCVSVFIGAVLLPMINSAMQSIIQTKVPADRLGRVFGAVMFFSQISAPLAMAVSGPLADHVFEPHGESGGVARLLGPLLGNGPGSGMAAMLLIGGICGIGAAIVGMTSRSVRDIDWLLPDLNTADAATDPEDGPRRRAGTAATTGTTSAE